MSNFTLTELSDLYSSNLPKFAELAEIAQKEKIEFEITIDEKGLIIMKSHEWSTNDEGKKTVRTHVVSQSPKRIHTETTFYVYD